MSLSAILITKNEEKNLKKCLDSISWIPDIVIVDAYSTDSTPDIARTYPQVTLIQSPWIGFVANKKIALAETKYSWVLWIDADEIMTEELKNEILQLLNTSTSNVLFDFPRKTYFMDEWVQHTGWYPGRVRRLFHKNFCHFNENILHEGLETSEPGRIGHLNADLLHYSYSSIYQYFDKMNFYGKAGAQELVRKGKRFSTFQLVVNPAMTFIKFFFLKKGFLDGRKGLIISIGSAFSNFIKYTNFYYLSRNEKNHHKQDR